MASRRPDIEVFLDDGLDTADYQIRSDSLADELGSAIAESIPELSGLRATKPRRPVTVVAQLEMVDETATEEQPDVTYGRTSRIATFNPTEPANLGATCRNFSRASTSPSSVAVDDGMRITRSTGGKRGATMRRPESYVVGDERTDMDVALNHLSRVSAMPPRSLRTSVRRRDEISSIGATGPALFAEDRVSAPVRAPTYISHRLPSNSSPRSERNVMEDVMLLPSTSYARSLSLPDDRLSNFLNSTAAAVSANMAATPTTASMAATPATPTSSPVRYLADNGILVEAPMATAGVSTTQARPVVTSPLEVVLRIEEGDDDQYGGDVNGARDVNNNRTARTCPVRSQLSTMQTSGRAIPRHSPSAQY